MTLKEIIENSGDMLSDEQIIAIWSEHQTTEKLFDLFEETIRRRIKLYRQYAFVVKNNNAYNVNLVGKDDFSNLLVQIRSMLMAGIQIKEEDYKDWYKQQGVEPPEVKEFLYQHVDGEGIIQEVNKIEGFC